MFAQHKKRGYWRTRTIRLRALRFKNFFNFAGKRRPLSATIMMVRPSFLRGSRVQQNKISPILFARTENWRNFRNEVCTANDMLPSGCRNAVRLPSENSWGFSSRKSTGIAGRQFWQRPKSPPQSEKFAVKHYSWGMRPLLCQDSSSTLAAMSWLPQ